MSSWIIEDYAVPYLLRINGFACERDGVSSWYVTNLPINFNGRYVLSDGFVIEAHGAVLKAVKPGENKGEPREVPGD